MVALYEIEKILRAERVGNRYRIWIQWQGYDDITWRWRHELVSEISDEKLLSDIADAVDTERRTTAVTHGSLPDDDQEPEVSSPAQSPDPFTEPADDRPISQRLRRNRITRALTVNTLMAAPEILQISDLLLSHLRDEMLTLSVDECRV